ncbi:response regulator [Desulfotalea psychrophila]|uniref:Related to two-component system response regulator (Ntr family) n=1 Tax=Desulfotalea psychrophila (strain LSv54 / DSM 12343) TaxID=177439 RepID=Q6AN54_DESPS|nr:response regulator [Desulfotalea psychrophila]CAG36220.1 related to two-component system response regulator (Ntr family) [Desulfotalea psychrophila LSv54]
MAETIKARVLLVDDEKDFIETLSNRLQIRGLTVSTSTCGQDALKLIEKEKFDVVVLDLTMPGMDGLETLKKLKETAPDTEIIMLSGHGTIQASTEAIKLGAEDFLEKPLDLPKLLEKISEAKDKRILISQEKATEAIKEILKNRAW